MYLKKDVLLSTHFFEIYSNTCKIAYNINRFCSYSTPSFTSKAGLSYTGVKLGYITDDKLGLLIKTNTRGGPSLCMRNRHKKRERKIVYADMNNLYSWSMSQFLPPGDFHENEVTKRRGRNFPKTFSRTPDNSICGYILDSDLEYPSNIH